MHFTTMLQLPIFATAIWSATATIMSKTTSPLLRGHHHFSPRNLVPHPNSGHHSSYYGCLGYSDSELSEAWSFSSQAPSCSWVHIYYSGNDSSGSQGGGGGSSGGSSSGSSSGGSSSSGSSSGSNGGNDDDGGSSGRSGNVDDDGNNNYNGDDDSYSGGGQGNDNDDEVVVTNEDVYSGDSEYDPIDDFDIEVVRTMMGSKFNWLLILNGYTVFSNIVSPLLSFFISFKCDTYDNLWLWDLSLSCDMTGGDLSSGGCNCTFAEELRDNGLLSCDDTSLCPEDCSICTTCMSLLGCDVAPENPLVSRLLSTTIMLYVIAAVVSLLIFALAAYYSRRKWQDERDLNTSLIEKQKHAGNIIGNDYDHKGPSFMYIDGDLMWKPLPSDQQYAASMVQPVGTMSTASTGKEYLEERVQPGSGPRSGGVDVGVGVSDNINRVRKEVEEEKTPDVDVSMCEDAVMVPTMVDTLDNIENGLVSPIQTSEETDSSEEDDDENYHDVFEDKIPSPMNSEKNEQQ